MKTLFASAIALSLLTGTAMAAPSYLGQNNGHQNQQYSQQDRTPNTQHQVQRTETVRTVTSTKYTYATKRGEYSYNGKTYKSVKAAAWRAPRGYDARQSWHRGQKLPAAFRARPYFVDYRANHLQRPAYGYEWVRVSDHAYLVNQRDGLVVQIVWHMFN